MRQAGNRQGRSGGTGTRHGNNRQPGCPDRRHNPPTRVGNCWRTRITDQRHGLTCRQMPGNLLRGLLLMVFIRDQHPDTTSDMAQQSGCTTCIFCSHHRYLPQNTRGARRQVFQIANRRCHHIQSARAVFCRLR